MNLVSYESKLDSSLSCVHRTASSNSPNWVALEQVCISTTRAYRLFPKGMYPPMTSYLSFARESISLKENDGAAVVSFVLCSRPGGMRRPLYKTMVSLPWAARCITLTRMAFFTCSGIFFFQPHDLKRYLQWLGLVIVVSRFSKGSTVQNLRGKKAPTFLQGSANVLNISVMKQAFELRLQKVPSFFVRQLA